MSRKHVTFKEELWEQMKLDAVKANKPLSQYLADLHRQTVAVLEHGTDSESTGTPKTQDEPSEGDEIDEDADWVAR